MADRKSVKMDVPAAIHARLAGRKQLMTEAKGRVVNFPEVFELLLDCTDQLEKLLRADAEQAPPVTGRQLLQALQAMDPESLDNSVVTLLDGGTLATQVEDYTFFNRIDIS